MKKLVTTIIAICLCFTLAVSFVGCGKKGKETGDFVPPTDYVSVVQITINPTVNLYLDSNQVILAVEYLNSDAKNSYEKIEDTLVGATLETGVDLVIETAAADGYLVENKEVTINIVETKAEDTNNIILKTANDAAKSALQEIQIEATVNVLDKGVVVTEDALNSANTTSSTTTDTSSDTSSQTVSSSVSTSSTTISSTTTSSVESKPAEQPKPTLKTGVEYITIKPDPFAEEMITVVSLSFSGGNFAYVQAPYGDISVVGEVPSDSESVVYNNKTYYPCGGGGSGGQYTVSSDIVTLTGGEDMDLQIISENELKIVRLAGASDYLSVGSIFKIK